MVRGGKGSNVANLVSSPMARARDVINPEKKIVTFFFKIEHMWDIINGA